MIPPIAIREFSYDALISYILDKYSNIDHEIRARHAAEKVSALDIGKWSQWVLAAKDGLSGTIMPQERDRHLIDILREAYDFYIRAYCDQFSPSLRDVKSYMALSSLCKRWNIPEKVIGDDITIAK